MRAEEEPEARNRQTQAIKWSREISVPLLKWNYSGWTFQKWGIGLSRGLGTACLEHS